MSAIIAETPRLLLREIDRSDAGFMFALVNSEAWLKNIGDRNVHSVSDAAAYIDRSARASYTANGFGLWMVLAKDSGERMGICGLIRRPGLEEVDIGFAFLPEYQGKGYAFEAATASLQQAPVFGLQKIVAITLPQNNSSIRLLERLGFQFSETVTLPGEDVLLSLYALTIKT